MLYLYLYPLAPAILIAVLNWIYWRKQGFTSKIHLGFGIIIFWAGFHILFKYFA